MTPPGYDDVWRMTDGGETAATARTNADWISALSRRDERQAAALAGLRALLVRTARFALIRSGRLRQASDDTLGQLAEDCAQEALIAILRRLGDFRGESRFTTWACKFAIYSALVASRREAWKHVSLEALGEPSRGRVWPEIADEATPDPERQARRAEAWAVVRDVIDGELSERQRFALTALVIDGLPLDELVRHWGSNRNAVYKLVHDARRRLKACLEARGFPADDVLALFGAARKIPSGADTKG